MKRRHYERPGYVTFLSVLLLVGAAAELLVLYMFQRGGREQMTFLLMNTYFPFTIVLSLVGGDFLLHSADWVSGAQFVISLACGVFMLKGANWGRMLFYTAYLGLCLWSYICWMVDNPLVIPFITCRMVILVAFCIALSMERANRYFLGRGTFFKSNRGEGGLEPRKSSPGRYDY
jgi:hypothetical protein